MSSKQDIIQKVYYDPAGFSSMKTTLQDARTKDKTTILEDVRTFFKTNIEQKKTIIRV